MPKLPSLTPQKVIAILERFRTEENYGEPLYLCSSGNEEKGHSSLP